MRKHDPVVSPTAIVYQDGAGVVHLMMMPGDRTIDLVQDGVRALLAIARDEPLYVLVEVLPLATIPRNVLVALYTSPILPHIRAVAFVGEAQDTAGIRWYAMELGPIAIPVQFFEAKVEVHTWLLALRAGDEPRVP